MAITREDIIKAAETLEKNGISPTMAAVRDHLGGGSFATISPILRGWKEGRKTIQAVVLDMPGELKSVLDTLGAEFWGAASRLSNEKLVVVQAEAEASVTAAESERDETLEEVNRLEEALASANQQQEAARNSEAETEKKCLSLKEDKIRLEEKVVHCHTEIEQLRADLRKVTRDKEQHADEASHLLGLNEQLKQELADARQQADTQRQEAMQNRLEADNLKSQMEQSKEDQQRQQTSLEQVQAESLKLKITVAGLEDRMDDRNIKIGQQEAELATLREKKQEEVQQIANLTAEREAGKARIRELVQECGALRQENKSMLLVNAKLGKDGD